MIKKSQLDKPLYRMKGIADMLNVHSRTVQRWCTVGDLKCTYVGNGKHGARTVSREDLIVYLCEQRLLLDDDNHYDVIYARVSTHKQKSKGDLDRQIALIKDFVIMQNPINLTIYSDVASGLNDNRKGFLSLLDAVQKGQVNRIFISHKDRLTRFGFGYIKAICDFHQVQIVVVSDEILDKDISQELAEDIIAIIHSFSGKLYELRKNIKERIQAE